MVVILGGVLFVVVLVFLFVPSFPFVPFSHMVDFPYHCHI